MKLYLWLVILPRVRRGKISLGALSKAGRLYTSDLQHAIQEGGTTLRDFVNEAGKPGYFKQQLKVYGRKGMPCVDCQQPLTELGWLTVPPCFVVIVSANQRMQRRDKLSIYLLYKDKSYNFALL